MLSNARPRKCLLIATVSVLMVALLFVLNHFMPMYADDYSYSFSFLTGERITTVSQILPSQIAHYNKTNGRIVTHALAQLFLLMEDTAFDLFNSIGFVGLVYLTYFHACGTLRNFSLSRFLVIATVLFLETPDFGQSFLWTTGAANYLYGIAIILCVMIPWRLQAEGRTLFSSPLAGVLAAAIFLLLGMVAGCTNENTAVAMIAMLLAYLLLFRVRSIPIRLWNITGCVGAIWGCVLMLTAPGTTNRMNALGGSGGILMWIKRFIINSTWLVVYAQLIILILAVLVCIYTCQKRHLLMDRSMRKILPFFDGWGIFLIYLLGMLGSVYSMIVSPTFPERAWSGPMVLFLIAVGSFSMLPDLSGQAAKLGKAIVVFSLLLTFMGRYTHAFIELRHVNEAFQEREAIIATALASGDLSVELPCIRGVNTYCGYDSGGDLNLDSRDWPNTTIADYYGVNEIIRIEVPGDS